MALPVCICNFRKQLARMFCCPSETKSGQGLRLPAKSVATDILDMQEAATEAEILRLSRTSSVNTVKAYSR